MAHWETIGHSDEWYTPAYVFEALGVQFDLDVAHPLGRKTFVPCNGFYHRDSLNCAWFGFVWMNPPFGGRNSLKPWLDKFFDHGNGIALVPDRTSAPWFRDAWERADLVLFTPKIRFHRPDGTTGDSPSNGTALMAAGWKGIKARDEQLYRISWGRNHNGELAWCSGPGSFVGGYITGWLPLPDTSAISGETGK